MIAKYPGLCAHCKKPIEPRVDHYDIASKKNYHAACAETSQPESVHDTAGGHALADMLGFVGHGEAIPDWWISGDRALRNLPAPH